MKPNRKSVFLSIALAVVISLAAVWPCTAGAPNPTPTDLGVLEMYGHNFSTANAINNAGQVLAAAFETINGLQVWGIWQDGNWALLKDSSGWHISFSGEFSKMNQNGQVLVAYPRTPDE